MTNKPKFIPQALCDEKSKSVLFVFQTEEMFAPWRDKIKTQDAPGVSTHPRLIKAGDSIDWFITGWSKAVVKSISFRPFEDSIEGYHVHGTYTFETDKGFISVRADGRNLVDAPIYKF